MIGSEALPFSKTGGLADVLGALPPALARLGWDVTLFVPRYRGVHAGEFRERFGLTVGGYYADVGLFEAPLGDGARAMLVDEPALFDREYLYGLRQRRLPRQPATVRAAGARGARIGRSASRSGPSIVHAHDWQAGLAPVYLQIDVRADIRLLAARRSCSRFTTSPIRAVSTPTGCRGSTCRGRCFTIEQLEFWGQISFLKGGINDADVDHDGQPAVREGNPDAAKFGERLRRRPARARRPISSAS